MRASARGWSEQDRASKQLILMLKTLLMVMFKTSKLWLMEKKHLHSGEVERMSSLESVKVSRRRRNAACLTAAFLWELLEKLWFRDAVHRLCYGHFSICCRSFTRPRTTTNVPSFWSATVQSPNYKGSLDWTIHAVHSTPDWTCDKKGNAAVGMRSW